MADTNKPDNTAIKKEEARQGHRVLGMPSTLGYSLGITFVGMLILLVIFN